jgi:hypothetical protein
MRHAWSLLAIPSLAVLSCVPVDGTPNGSRPLVNLQVTEDRDLVALEQFMDELDFRGINATLIVNEYVATQGCDQLRLYDAAGHEIMVYGRPDEPPGQTVELTMLSSAEQEAIITGAKEAIEDCLGHTVEGFRSYHFAHNEDTWQILDGLRIKYNLSYVAHSNNAPAGHTNDIWPCPVEGHFFWAVPMHSIQTAGGTRAFCDRPFRSLEAGEWESLMEDELVRMYAANAPLKVEFHPWFSANDEGRWNAFLGFLDFAQNQEAEFITVFDMLARLPEKE